MSKSKKSVRVLAFDISLSCPGAAVVEIRNGKAKIIAVSHVKTKSADPYPVKSEHISAWAQLFARANQTPSKPYDVIVREKYSGKFGNYPIFSAWGAVDRALHILGLEFNADPIPQQTVKKEVFGKGRAEKDELAEAVRKLTGYKGDFATSDESDAVAIALAYAIQQRLITG